MASIIDNITKALAPVYRKLNDIQVNNLLGSECTVLRIATGERDVFGDSTEQLESYVLTNVIITHPYAGNVEIFEKYNALQNNTETHAIDIWEVLPIYMKIPLHTDEKTTATNIKKGDIIVQALFDTNNNVIPLVMTVTKSFGTILNKTIIAKKYQLTLYRGIISADIQQEIDNYINSLKPQ